MSARVVAIDSHWAYALGQHERCTASAASVLLIDSQPETSKSPRLVVYAETPRKPCVADVGSTHAVPPENHPWLGRCWNRPSESRSPN